MAQFFSQIVLVLLTILSFQLVSAQLSCWRCDPCPDPHSNSSTEVKNASCTTSQKVCVKNTVKVLNRPSQISKGCVESCTPSSSNFFGQGAFVDCCNTDFCNGASMQTMMIPIVFIPLLWLFRLFI